MSERSYARMDRALEDMARKIGDFRIGTPGYECKALVRSALSIVDKELCAIRELVTAPKAHQDSKFQKAAALVREALEVAKNAYEEGQGSQRFPWSMASANLAAENIEKALEALENEA